MVNESDKPKIEEICRFAELRHLRRGDALLCKEGKGIAPQVPAPLLREGDVCVATTFYSSGHLNPEVYHDTSRMRDCPYRKT